MLVSPEWSKCGLCRANPIDRPGRAARATGAAANSVTRELPCWFVLQVRPIAIREPGRGFGLSSTLVVLMLTAWRAW